MKNLTAAEYLKTATRKAHQQTERAANSRAIMQGSIGPEAYAMILQANYQVWASIKSQLQTWYSSSGSEPSWRIFDLDFTSHLLNDLRQFTNKNNQFQYDLPPFLLDSQAAVLGALYVLNGSTLGGKYLYQALTKNNNLAHLQDFYFYRACSEVPANYWPRFQAYLNEQLISDEKKEEARKTAIKVFEQFETAYQKMDFPEKIT